MRLYKKNGCKKLEFEREKNRRFEDRYRHRKVDKGKKIKGITNQCQVGALLPINTGGR